MSENQKKCECGCGRPVLAGSRFVRGHHRRGEKISDETREKLKAARAQRSTVFRHSDAAKEKISQALKKRPPELQQKARTAPKKHHRLRKGSDIHQAVHGAWQVRDHSGKIHKFRNAMEFVRQNIELIRSVDRFPNSKTPIEIRFSNALSQLRDGGNWNGWRIIVYKPDPEQDAAENSP